MQFSSKVFWYINPLCYTEEKAYILGEMIYDFRDFFFLNGILARRVAIGLNPVETVEIFFVAQVLANVPYCVSLERKKRNKKKS